MNYNNKNDELRIDDDDDDDNNIISKILAYLILMCACIAKM